MSMADYVDANILVFIVCVVHLLHSIMSICRVGSIVKSLILLNKRDWQDVFSIVLYCVANMYMYVLLCTCYIGRVSMLMRIPCAVVSAVFMLVLLYKSVKYEEYRYMMKSDNLESSSYYYLAFVDSNKPNKYIVKKPEGGSKYLKIYKTPFDAISGLHVQTALNKKCSVTIYAAKIERNYVYVTLTPDKYGENTIKSYNCMYGCMESINFNKILTIKIKGYTREIVNK